MRYISVVICKDKKVDVLWTQGNFFTADAFKRHAKFCGDRSFCCRDIAIFRVFLVNKILFKNTQLLEKYYKKTSGHKTFIRLTLYLWFIE